MYAGVRVHHVRHKRACTTTKRRNWLFLADDARNDVATVHANAHANAQHAVVGKRLGYHSAQSLALRVAHATRRRRCQQRCRHRRRITAVTVAADSKTMCRDRIAHVKTELDQSDEVHARVRRLLIGRQQVTLVSLAETGNREVAVANRLDFRNAITSIQQLVEQREELVEESNRGVRRECRRDRGEVADVDEAQRDAAVRARDQRLAVEYELAVVLHLHMRHQLLRHHVRNDQLQQGMIGVPRVPSGT